MMDDKEVLCIAKWNGEDFIIYVNGTYRCGSGWLSERENSKWKIEENRLYVLHPSFGQEWEILDTPHYDRFRDSILEALIEKELLE